MNSVVSCDHVVSSLIITSMSESVGALSLHLAQSTDVTEALGMQEKPWTTSGVAGMAGNRKTRNDIASKIRAKE